MDRNTIIQQVVGDDNDLIAACSLLWERGESKLKQLYGSAYQDVIEKCYEVSPYFCFHVVTNVYAIWWRISQLSDYERSLVTCCALLVTGQINQFQVLVNTFLSSGGSHSKLGSILNYMLEQQYIEQQILNDLHLSSENIDALCATEYLFVDLSCSVALQRDLSHIVERIPTDFDKNKLILAVNHLLTYIGCPIVWDSTLALRKLVDR